MRIFHLSETIENQYRHLDNSIILPLIHMDKSLFHDYLLLLISSEAKEEKIF